MTPLELIQQSQIFPCIPKSKTVPLVERTRGRLARSSRSSFTTSPISTPRRSPPRAGDSPREKAPRRSRTTRDITCLDRHSRNFPRFLEIRQLNHINTVNKLIFLALVVGGIILIIYGISASDSIGSSFSRFFTGSPTDKTIWLLLGGIVATAVGLVGMLRGAKSNL